MNWIKNLSLGSKLLILPTVFALSFIIFETTAYLTLEEARIKGAN